MNEDRRSMTDMENDRQLEPGTLLKGGVYRIVRVVGQDEGTITYEGEQLQPYRKVIVRAFIRPDDGSDGTPVSPVIDRFEENGTLFHVLKEPVELERKGRQLWATEFGKEIFIKPLSDSAPVDRRTESEPVDRQAQKADLRDMQKGRKPGRVGLWLGLALGALSLALAVFLLMGRHKGEHINAGKDRLVYDRMVTTCRDSILVWGDFRGTVPKDAMDLLVKVKRFESVYGQGAEGFDESYDLAYLLLEKMKVAKDKWEVAGNAQRFINSDRARECYTLALDLADAISTVERDVLGMEGVSQ